MRFRIGYMVSRGNDLENEDYMDDEMLFLRHKSIHVGDRFHDRDTSTGWLMVPTLEQAVWMQRHYARTSRYVDITATAVVVEPEELKPDALNLRALLQRLTFVLETLELDHKGVVFLRHTDSQENLATDIAALLAYKVRIEPLLLAMSQGNNWDTAGKPYRDSLVARTSSEKEDTLVVAAEAVPFDAAGIRRMAELLRGQPRRHVTLRYEPGDFNRVQIVSELLSHVTGASVMPVQV